MEKMTKPHEENASTMEAFRVFDGEGSGVIDSRTMRDVIMKSLEQVSFREIQDMLDHSGLLQDRPITYEGMIFVYPLGYTIIFFFKKVAPVFYSIHCPKKLKKKFSVDLRVI